MSQYQNITKKYLPEESEIHVIIELKHEYNISLKTLIEMIAIWDMKLLGSKNNDPIAKVSMKYRTFLNLFKEKPYKNKVYMLYGTESFIERVKVIDVKD